MLNILVLAAGRGSRFAAKGYTDPKPFISIGHETMIVKVAKNLAPINRTDVRFIFMLQKDQVEKYDVMSLLSTKNIAPGAEFNAVGIDVGGITKGAACTALLASDYLDTDDELIIANSDQLVDEGEMVRWEKFLSEQTEDLDAVIMGFKSNLPKWSYVSVDKEGIVNEVAEKKVISDNATVGIYYFKKGKDFVKAAKKMIVKDITTNGEFYVCPVYNELVIEGKKTKFFELESSENFHGLGDPESLEAYLSNLNA